ncbi:MAG: response regulator transcription factor [Cytophagales bacterium]|nr:response regulator transcription factor [Cytophagales bacterium]
MIKAVIIDDDQDSIDYLKYLASHRNDLLIAGEAINATMGISEVRRHNPEVLFLDIDMPLRNGLDLLDELDREAFSFSTIFTTGYRQFAIDAIKKGAYDYLLKPIDKEEFNQTIDRLIGQQYLLLKNGKRIRMEDIIFIQSEGNDLIFNMNSEEDAPRIRQTFKELLPQLSDAFVHLHRSYVVNRNHINVINNHSVMMSNSKLINVSPKLSHNLFHHGI